MHPDKERLPPANHPAEPDPEELVAEDAEDLPERDAMSLLDPGLLGGIFSSGSGVPTGLPTTDGSGTGLPATDTTAPVGQSASDATQLANQYAPPADASQPYEPTVSDTAQS